MPRYMVERTLPDGWRMPVGTDVIERNMDEGVTWLHSYVGDDGQKTFCVYDAPSPEAIRTTAARTHLPVDRITKVQVLDPYPYRRLV